MSFTKFEVESLEDRKRNGLKMWIYIIATVVLYIGTALIIGWIKPDTKPAKFKHKIDHHLQSSDSLLYIKK